MSLKYWVFIIATLLISATPAIATVSKQVREEFTRLVDTHRSVAREFEVKKTSVQNNPSFANQESYTTASKNMLISLDRVWSQYWTILISEISDRRGFGGTVADETISKLAQEIDFLNKHSQAVAPLTSLDEVRSQAALLTNRGLSYPPLAYTTLTTIKRARFAYTAQQLEAFRLTLLSIVDQQILDPGVLEARKRGLAELGPILATVASSSATISSAETRQFERDPQEGYSEWLINTQPAHAQLLQIYSRLKELSLGLEL